MHSDPAQRRTASDESGAIGWLIIGVVLGVILVIWVIARIIGGIF